MLPFEINTNYILVNENLLFWFSYNYYCWSRHKRLLGFSKILFADNAMLLYICPSYIFVFWNMNLWVILQLTLYSKLEHGFYCCYNGLDWFQWILEITLTRMGFSLPSWFLADLFSFVFWTDNGLEFFSCVPFPLQWLVSLDKLFDSLTPFVCFPPCQMKYSQ